MQRESSSELRRNAWMSFCLVLAGCMPTCTCAGGSNGAASNTVAAGAAAYEGNTSPSNAVGAVGVGSGAAGVGGQDDDQPVISAPAILEPESTPGQVAPLTAEETVTGAPGVAVEVAPMAPAKPAASTMLEAFPDFDKSSKSIKAKLATAKKSLSAPMVADKRVALSTRAKLDALLPSRVAGLSAQRTPISIQTKAAELPVSASSRLYKEGPREIYIKITDTAHAPFMRDPIVKRLDQIGDASKGFLHGRMVGGSPAIAQYFPEARNNQLMVLVNNRYVVEVRIAGATSSAEAQRVFEHLKLDSLK